MKEIIQEEEHQNNQKVIEEVGYLSGVYNFSILLGFFDRKSSVFLDSQRGFHFRVVWLIASGGFYFMVFVDSAKKEKWKEKNKSKHRK